MSIEIAVVIPVYNNQFSLRELNSRIANSLAGLSYKVLYVNDCSTDGSLEVLNELSKKDPDVQVLDLKTNLGQQKATLQGLKSIEAAKIVVLDADLQDKPELIPRLYQHCKDTRMTTYIKRVGRYQSRDRMITSLIIKSTIQVISGLHRKAGSFYIFDQTIKEKVVHLAEKCATPYLTIVVSSCSPGISYIPSTRSIGAFGSNYNFRKRLLSARAGIKCALFCRFTSLRS